jgi:hypothetical protein
MYAVFRQFQSRSFWRDICCLSWFTPHQLPRLGFFLLFGYPAHAISYQATDPGLFGHRFLGPEQSDLPGFRLRASARMFRVRGYVLPLAIHQDNFMPTLTPGAGL